MHRLETGIEHGGDELWPPVAVAAEVVAEDRPSLAETFHTGSLAELQVQQFERLDAFVGCDGEAEGAALVAEHEAGRRGVQLGDVVVDQPLQQFDG
ncbi:hypothetical protein [Gandjariella thermophila]|uniref:Uncharacterized protein n=1 Tax=Gandjariella thermophila TaxID=1931992 RepID=A0A4D4JCL8_9PSEU|nr:hypothetical protein [Gandjariella thermophila]GDY32186.1 hypothetical protein GTS_38190 [Gandjariella thermophila]